jgi:hypothetical protein
MMPYPNAQVTNRAPHIRTFSRSDGESFVFAVVETNAKDHRSYKGDILDRLVNAARARAVGSGTAAEASFASALTEHLEVDETFRHNIGAVFYAAVALDTDSQRVVVRTAGDLRVHAVDARGLVCGLTRDHNAIDDDAEGVYKETMVDQRQFLLHVPTRAIPATERKPIERVEWSTQDIEQLIICSSVVHQYRNPTEYLARLLEDLEGAVPPFGFGAIVSIATSRAPARNLKKYGDQHGPTVDYLRGQGKTWEQINQGATTPSGADILPPAVMNHPDYVRYTGSARLQ